MAKYRMATLFSGAGGLDTAFYESEKFNLIFANDVLDAPGKSYSKNYSHTIVDAKNFTKNSKLPAYAVGNITDINFAHIGKLHCLVGGPPCQDFSVARGGAGAIAVRQYNKKTRHYDYVKKTAAELINAGHSLHTPVLRQLTLDVARTLAHLKAGEQIVLKKRSCPKCGKKPCSYYSRLKKLEKSKRRGTQVKRGRLYQEYVRAIIKTRPNVFAFENVPGLMSWNDGLAYKTIVSDFKSHGYKILFSDIANATKVGVPQTRRRLLILGARDSTTEKLSDINSRVRDILTGAGSLLRKYPICAMEALEGKTVPELAGRYRKVMKQYEGVDKEVNKARLHPKKWRKNVWDKLTFNAVDDYLHANKIEKKDRAEIDEAFREHKKILTKLGYYGSDVRRRKFKDDSNEIPNEGGLVPGRMKHTPPGENYIFVNGTKWKVAGTMSNIYRRTDPLRPAFTVMAYGGGGTWSYHYDRDRGMLTNRERARLQTFPDSYMFEGDRSQVRAQIGEAVPVQLGRKIAEIATLVLEQ